MVIIVQVQQVQEQIESHYLEERLETITGQRTICITLTIGGSEIMCMQITHYYQVTIA